MDILGHMIELNIQDFFILMKNMRNFLVELDIMLKSNISDVYSHKNTKKKINSEYDPPLEQTLNMHNVVILIKSILNKKP